MNIWQRVSEYAKLIRSFNAGLTGVAPVLGALCMWGVRESSLAALCILFLIGFLSHIYGFVLNDWLDVKIDRLSKELAERPLVSGTIAMRNALILALGSLVLAWALCLVFFNLWAFGMLLIGYTSATIYNFISKKLPGMDFFVAGAIFFLILTGCVAVSPNLTTLAWVVATLGFLQVLFMNAINGGLKDIDHDFLAGAKTAAVALGVEVQGKKLKISNSFKAYGYGISVAHLGLIFVPFSLLHLNYWSWQIFILLFLSGATLYLVTKLLTMQRFDRQQVRKFIGTEVICMYALAPIMLMSLNWYIAFLAFLPPLWFIASNLMLHGTVMRPQTM